MRGRSGRHQSQAGGGLLFVVVVALLIAPILFVVALFNLAGPSTRAALAGEVPDQPAALVSPSAAGSPDDAYLRPLSGVGSDPAADVAPIFEPRVGRFRLDNADPGAEDDVDHQGHAHPAGGDGLAVESPAVGVAYPSMTLARA